MLAELKKSLDFLSHWGPPPEEEGEDQEIRLVRLGQVKASGAEIEKNLKNQLGNLDSDFALEYERVSG